ncbi:MAG: diacylglycerol kinase family lipid kinase, partial [Acholeplasmataceae bacterium]|nr:diacylglycerol kinase family lipid kinase [Acholeplasmataceae bacterium]
TLNEVVNGVVGYPNAAITCYPCGSGNDFIKYFGKAEDFLNLKALSSGKEKVIDLVKFNDSYVANIFNIGFDADVCERMIRYKRLPLISGKGAYILGVIVSFFKKLTHHLRITKDGEEIFNGEGMLCAMANAICYGGGFYCAPHASVTDGLLDIVVVRKLSRMKFLKFIKIYKNGEHLDKEELKEYIIYHQGKAVTIESSEPINCCFDGDIAKAQKFEIEIIPQALRFVVPEKL